MTRCRRLACNGAFGGENLIEEQFNEVRNGHTCSFIGTAGRDCAAFAEGAHGVTLINIQMTPIYIMKDLDLPGSMVSTPRC